MGLAGGRVSAEREVRRGRDSSCLVERGGA